MQNLVLFNMVIVFSGIVFLHVITLTFDLFVLCE